MSKVISYILIIRRYSEHDFTKKKEKYIKYSLADFAELIESTIKTTRVSTAPAKK
jgi:hypothetical protein